MTSSFSFLNADSSALTVAGSLETIWYLANDQLHIKVKFIDVGIKAQQQAKNEFKQYVSIGGMATFFAGLVIAQLLILSTSLNSTGNRGKKPLLVQRLLRNVPLNEEKLLYHGGYRVEAEEIPFIAALNFRGRRFRWFCTGSILAHHWILTVASCTSRASQAKISYGAARRDNRANNVYVSSKCFFPHPGYEWPYTHDIALIQTPYITFSKAAVFVDLPTYSPALTNLWTRSAGWGVHQGSKDGENRELHVVQLQVSSNHECSLGGYGKRFSANMICGVIPNRETSCRLDSGSPLVLESNVLIGIASFGSDSGCRSNKLLGYTRITSYTSWLASVMNEND